jgi:hypothetical protein
MATRSTPQLVSVADPTVARQLARAVAQEQASGSSAPVVVTNSETLFNQATATTSTVGENSTLTVTSSPSNSSGDVVTVYQTTGGIAVTAVNETVNQYTYTAPAAGVTQIIAGNNVSITSTNGDGSGVVTINASVANLGNISSINLNGNSSSVLRGDGTWGADANSSYGDSNVVSLLGSFGSNTITTTGNVSVGNISATNLGNIVGTNYDGNASNVLHGDGSWSADVTDYGNSNVAAYLPTYTGNITGDYANFTHDVTANIVDAAFLYGDGSNISNLAVGNIASINLDGNSSNVLRGDGTWAVDGSTPAGNTAEVQFNSGGAFAATGNFTFTNGVDGGVIELGSSSALQLIGNGTIQNPAGNLVVTANSATWRFYDDGNLMLPGNAVAIKFLNGSSAFGNIVSVNLDGNASNVLRGDGTFGADANSSYGDSNVTSLLGAFGSNTITTTGVITGDGYGLSNVPYANITGTPSLGNIASVNLDGNVSNLLTGNGTFVAIPTVPTVGNIATINLDGNASNVLLGNGAFGTVPGLGNIASINLDGSSSNVLYGNGAFAAAPSSTYGDSNVVTLLGSFGSNTISTTGNVATGAVTAADKIGYSAGANVTQTTSRGTGVTLNALSGEITLVSATMTAGQVDTFTMTNNKVSADDIIVCTTRGGSFGTYLPLAYTITDTQVAFVIRNLDSSTTSSEAPVIKFIVIKAPVA